MSNQVAGISCIIYVIVVIIILIIIIAIILAIAIVIDFVIFIVVTLCWSGGSWQPSTRPSSSPALSCFQKSVFSAARAVEKCHNSGVVCSARSTMAQYVAHVPAGSERSAAHSKLFFGAATQCSRLHGEVPLRFDIVLSHGSALE